MADQPEIPDSSSSASLIVTEKEVPPLPKKSLQDKLVDAFAFLKKYIPSLSPKEWRGICLLLHIALVVLHISLLVVGCYNQEQNVTFEIRDSFETLNGRLSLVLQAFVTIYTAILVAMLQSLSLRNELSRLQTLTATSDKARSWSGLGSAVYVLWQQFFLFASQGIFAITAYLALITVLHNTTPALIGLELYNATTNVQASTIGGFPTPGDDLTMGIINTAGFIPFLGTASNFTFPGLYNNTLHEVLQHPGVGRAVVNATTFEVSCGTIKNISNPAPFVEGTDYWLLQNRSYRATVIPQGILRTRALFSKTDDGSIYLFASINVTDSNGTLAPQISLSPPMLPEHDTAPGLSPKPPFPPVDTLSVFGCTLSRISQKAVIDAATGVVVSLDRPSWKTQSKWEEWKQPGDSSSTFWTFMVYQSPKAYRVPPTDCINCDYPNLIDEYLMSKLGLMVKNGTERSLSFASVRLHELENGLSAATAAAVWAAAQFESPAGSVGQTLFPRGYTTVETPKIRARFKMNLTIAVIGLTTSLVLAILAFFLSRPSPSPSPNADSESKSSNTNSEAAAEAVESLGVLELLWVYSKKRDKIQELMEDVDEPTADNLRKAGLVQVRLADYHADDGEARGAYVPVECTNTDVS